MELKKIIIIIFILGKNVWNKARSHLFVYAKGSHKCFPLSGTSERLPDGKKKVLTLHKNMAQYYS